MEGTWKKLTNKVDLYASKPVNAGTDVDGSPTFVARAPLTTQMIPGKLVVRQNDQIYFYCSHDGREFPVDNKFVEFLVNDGYCWETSQRKNGEVPANAIIGGTGVSNMAHYIGRACHEKIWIPGKIDGISRCLFISYDYNEYRKDEYYVLVKPEAESNGRNSSGGCLKYGGRIFTGCKINITNCAFFKIN